MSEQAARRSAVLAVVGFVALTVAVFAYTRSATADQARTQGLHRSNAVRRPQGHRRWRRGYQPQELGYDPTEQALRRLQHQQNTGQSYGWYQNSYILPTPEDSENINASLIPSNLDPLYYSLASRYPDWTPRQLLSLREHIHMMFVQNFLREEYPTGYLIGHDTLVLESAMEPLGVLHHAISSAVSNFDAGQHPVNGRWSPLGSPQNPAAPQPPGDGAGDNEAAPPDVLQNINRGAGPGEDSEGSLQPDNEEDTGGSQNMLDLLYHIAEEQAKRDGFIHRGVECNSCGTCPIQGIRYHCANCFDYDLCETCEEGQVHIRNHVFYKIRIPAPSRGHIKQVVPKWYPGNPNAFPQTLPRAVSRRLLDEVTMDRTEVDALYEQFKCLAGHEYPSDPSQLGMAIDRRGFDLYFVPNAPKKPSPPNLIYDRIFAFYDTNGDGLIGFEEYLKGLADLQNKSRMARLSRIFKGYDLDGDGYVERKDFLRMFRAHYTLSKELSREMVNTQEDFGYMDEEIREVVQGSQPISAAFGGNVLYGHESRTGEDKQLGPNGDLSISNGPNGVLRNDVELYGDRSRAVGNAAIGHRLRSHPFRTFREEPPADEPLMHLPMPTNFELLGIQHADDATEEDLNGSEPPLQAYGWPPLLAPEAADIVNALGVDLPLEEITDPVDRSRVFYAQSQRLDEQSDRFLERSRKNAVKERWERRQFYLDEEEGMSKPQGYTEPDSSEEGSERGEVLSPRPGTTSSSRRHSLRSRSSSKVRFDDSAIDTDYETRSNTSSKSIPMNERWGGFELSGPEMDVGKDVLYQAVQQGFNELLDAIFKEKEDEAMEAQASRRLRLEWKDTLWEYEQKMALEREKKEEALKQADMLRTVELLQEGSAAETQPGAQADSHTPSRAAQAVKPNEQPPQDPNDHIEIMFGGMVRREVEKALNIAQSGGVVEESIDEEVDRDPTLPQFRPDDAGGSTHVISEPPLPPLPEVLAHWVRHKAVESEAERRGGYGRLNFKEFRFKMVQDDEVGQAQGADVGRENEVSFWESSADLGKLAFVGTWLEMASF